MPTARMPSGSWSVLLVVIGAGIFFGMRKLEMALDHPLCFSRNSPVES